MTRLISQYEATFGVSEEDEAFRLRRAYGWQRSCTLVHVFELTCASPYRAFWFRVGVLLADQSDGVFPWELAKERARPVSPTAKKISVTVGGSEVTRTQFLTWLDTSKVGKA